MDTKMDEIYELLKTKSHTKQFVYRNTLNIFQQFKQTLQKMEVDLSTRIAQIDAGVEIRYFDKGAFEAQFKFSGDTMVVMMHTNVFDFSDDHYIYKNAYIKEDPLREFCGMIQIYNFLSDSLKYNRNEDVGVLVARIFINKDNRFFIEGKRPLSFLYNDISANEMTEQSVLRIIEEAMLYCLRFDLIAPNLDSVNYLTVEQKNMENYSSGFPTSKSLGFKMSRDIEPL